MSKKDNLSAGVRQEFDDVDYWHKLPKNKFVQLPNGKKISIYEYMKKFMHESYANNFSRKDPQDNILQTEDQKKWGRRNNNNTNRDALNVIKKSGKMASLFHIESGNNPNSEEDWESILKSSGYEKAFEHIVKKYLTKLNIKFTIENSRIILQFFFTVKRFLKAMRKDKNNKFKICNSCNKELSITCFNKDNRTKDGFSKICKNCRLEKK